MSVIAYYVQVSLEQLQLIKEKPALVWEIKEDPRFAKAALMDMDQDWQVISWLVSPKKRLEQKEYAANMRVVNVEYRAGNHHRKKSENEFKQEVAKEMAKMGDKPVDTKNMPTDLLLTGIEGRGKQAPGLPDIDIGYGVARIFVPSEVKGIADAFDLTKESAIKAQFNRTIMAKYDVGVSSWETEPDSVLEQFLLPSYRAINKFYQRAAKAQHYVMVFYQ